MSGANESLNPGIRVSLHGGRIAVQRQDIDVARALCQRPLRDALNLIPTLLPVCGAAQQLAAVRAVAAASSGQHDLAGAAEQLDARLPQEQLEACAWRLAIDWPRVLGESPDLAAVQQMRDADDQPARARVARRLLPGLDTVRHFDDIWRWAQERHCPTARVLHAARRHDGPTGTHSLLEGAALVAAARAQLGTGTTQPTEAAEVGPLAMRRHPLLESNGEALTSHRLVAQVLDFLHLLASPGNPGNDGCANAWREADGSGVGRAQTARGPVFHRVVLDVEESCAVDWQLLAPTDWHFAPCGPVAAAASSLDALPYLVLSFDPCTPWAVASDAEPPVREMSHA